ncbi:DnaJ domain-containing protein [Phenylobacterium sp.]|uniref:J domain-containing protein n=1 Tax=Phenylobacterium sp. TaxID=1871053 RepID=UPI0025E30C31|nr:DnaJ domain-containing protein [Phenylobacterium sp.]
MLYLALGGAALAFYLYVTGGKPLFKGRDWRIASGGAALAAFTAAAFLGVRGEWAPCIALVVVGLWFASTARKRAPRAAPASGMSLDEARRILGVEPGATRAEIQAAYTRLMRLAHPDKGGTVGLASQLNAARDRLLSK